MGNGWRIDRISGISITVDRSWAFMLLLVVWGLAQTIFPDLHPQWGSTLDWGAALTASLLLFLSVLVHELAHWLVARANGIPVRAVTLFIFGGVSDTPREPAFLAPEIATAMVGPVTSIVLGLAFLFASGTMAIAPAEMVSKTRQALAGLGPLSTVLLWLGVTNILLGVLNMLPGLPLDGGRLLRSILQVLTKDSRRATRYARWTGQLIAWVLVAVGGAIILGVSLPVFGTSLIGGLGLGLVGWILYKAAERSDSVQGAGTMENVPAQVERARMRTVPANIPITSLVDQFVLGTDERSFLVIDNDSLVGLVRSEDVLKVPRERWDMTEVGEIMTSVGQPGMARPGQTGADPLDGLRNATQGQ